MQSFVRGHSLSWRLNVTRLHYGHRPLRILRQIRRQLRDPGTRAVRLLCCLRALCAHGSHRSQSALPAHALRSPSGRAVAVGWRGHRRADLLPTCDPRELRALRAPVGSLAPNERSAH